MHDEEPSERSVPSSGKREERDAALAVVQDEHLARCIEAALLPIRSRLSREQVEIVRSVLCSSIETDPVSRLLAKNAVQAYTARAKRQREPRSPCEDEAAAPAALDRNCDLTK